MREKNTDRRDPVVWAIINVASLIIPLIDVGIILLPNLKPLQSITFLMFGYWWISVVSLVIWVISFMFANVLGRSFEAEQMLDSTALKIIKMVDTVIFVVAVLTLVQLYRIGVLAHLFNY